MLTEFPKHLHKAGGEYLEVRTEAQERAALADGWQLTPVLDEEAQARVAAAPPSTEAMRDDGAGQLIHVLEFPKHVHKPGGEWTEVRDVAQERAALAAGWSLAPVLDEPIAGDGAALTADDAVGAAAAAGGAVADVVDVALAGNAGAKGGSKKGSKGGRKAGE